MTYREFDLTVNPKRNDEILVTNVNPSYLTVSKLDNGEFPNYRISSEISISDVSTYGGLTFIPSLFTTCNSTAENYLSFDVDEDATVYVCYEVLDNLLTSTVPEWLSNGFTKQPGQIVAQYRYYDIYTSEFPKGSVTLPGPAASANGVETGYFVLVKKSSAPQEIPLTLSTTYLPRASVFIRYRQQLACTGGRGDVQWTVFQGSLPPGLVLDEEGILRGYPSEAGDFGFGIRVSDGFGNADSAGFSMHIDSVYASLLKIHHLDTAFIMNSGAHDIPLYGIVQDAIDTSRYTLTAVSFPAGILSVGQPEILTTDSFNLYVQTMDNAWGNVQLFLNLVDKSDPDPRDNSVSSPFLIKVLPFLNHAPECNPVPDITAGLNVGYLKHQVHLTGIGDGNDGSQNISIDMQLSNPSVLRNPRLTYKPSEDSALITFYPEALGTTTVTLHIRDDGGTDLGGTDSLVVAFTVTVLESNGTGTPAAKEFKVYPNPATDKLYINLPGHSGKAQAVLYNLHGKIIRADEIINTGSFSLDGCPSGLYLLKVVSGSDIFQGPVVISR